MVEGVLDLVPNTENSIFEKRKLDDCKAKPPGEPRKCSSGYDGFDDEADDDVELVPLTREQVQQLGLNVPDAVMERQLFGQLAVAVAAALLVWLLVGDTWAVAAAVFGAGCSFVPAVFFVVAMRMSGSSLAGGGLLRFLVYEAGRLLLSLVMLVAGAYGFGSGADKTALLCMVLTYIAVLKLGWVQMLVSVLPRRL